MTRARLVRAPLLPLGSVLMAAITALASCRATEPAFVLKIKNEINTHERFSVFVLPEEEIEIEVLQTTAAAVAQAESGQLAAVDRNKWHYRAPANPGLSFLEISAPPSAQNMRVGVFVLIPFAQLQGEYLHHYRIGAYPAGERAYDPPAGFIEVTAENQDTFLTPNFQLKQFLCKQPGGYPKYLVLRERLLLALEHVLRHAQAAGYKITTLAVLSGYRTPYYNDSIENVSNSRHIYGDAADVFIDADADGRMDDLDDDGDVDSYDVKIWFDFIDRLSRRETFQPFTGGLGLYRKTTAHDGFVHVDTRGAEARW